MKVLKVLLVLLLCFSIFAVDGFLAANEEKKEKEKNNDGAKNYLVVLKDNVEKETFIDSKKIKEKKLKEKNPKKFKHTNAFSVELTEAEVKEFQADKDVKILEEDSTVAITTGQVGQEQNIPWGISAIGSTEGFNQDLFGGGIKVAIFDTGISEHKDLTIAGGVSFVKDTKNFADDNGHGTHVAGTLSALNNQIGVVGAAPSAELYAVKVLNNSGEGSYSQVIQGIDWAIDNQMNIISMSFGGMAPSIALHEAIKKANEKGILLVASAGNFGMGEETEAYPARFPEVLSIGAIDNTNQRASFSSTGSELDLVAPGVNIFSTTYDGEYGYNSGTSMAAPHVAGAAAVIWSKEKDLTNEEVKNILLETATPLGQKNEYGNGLVNVAKALGLSSSNEPKEPDSPEVNLTSELRRYESRLTKIAMILKELKNKAIEMGNIELSNQIDEDYNRLIIEYNARFNELEQINNNDSPEIKDKNIEYLNERLFMENFHIFQKLEDYFQERINEYLQLLGLTEEEVKTKVEPFSGTILELNKILDLSFSQGDYEIYTFTPSVTKSYTISTSPFQGTGRESDTILSIYTDSNLTNLIAYNDDYNGTVFSQIKINLTAGTTYYIKLGHYDFAGAVHARFGVFDENIPKTLEINVPQDVNIPQGSQQIYWFRVNEGGSYRFTTSYFANNPNEGTSDTVLYIYTDASLTKQIGYNNNANGTTFSSVDLNLTNGTEVYIKLMGNNSTAVHARINVSKNILSHSVLSINEPLDVNIGERQFMSFSFTPTISGLYEMKTGPFGGTGSQSDTQLHLYQDSALTKLLTYNDDEGLSKFSNIKYHLNAGQTYYIVLMGSYQRAMSARLSINSGSQYVYDAAGRLDYIILKDGREMDYQYDLNGNLVKKVIISQ